MKIGPKIIPNLIEQAGNFLKPVQKPSVLKPKPVNTKMLSNLRIAPNIKYAQRASSQELRAMRKLAFEHPEKFGMTKGDYYILIDNISQDVKRQVVANPKGMRREIVENADKIHRWSEIFNLQSFKNGKDVLHPFYDKKVYDKAVKEYAEFIEKMTGKKVLIGCPSRMNVCAVGLLNNPDVYKNADCILIGHGHNSSLITDIANPNTWSFSDNNKSIWKFIEDNVEKGKEVLTFCCETDGLKLAGKNASQMVDRTGRKMSAIGYPVALNGGSHAPIKICRSGTRHIIGEVRTKTVPTRIASNSYPFCMYSSTSAEPIYYDLDLSKFQV